MKRVLQVRVLPLLVWLATIVLVLFLWNDVGQRSPIIGFVEADQHRVTSAYRAKIVHIAVSPGQQVAAGQVLATLDASEIEAEMRIEEAESERIKAEIAATGVKEQLNALTATTRLAQASEGAAMDLAKLEAELRYKSAELESLTAKRKELSSLVANGMMVKRDLISLELRYAALENEVRTGNATQKVLREQVASTKTRRKALPEQVVELSVSPLKAALTVVERRLERLQALRESLSLRAPCDGRVSAVHMHEGAVAQEREPVITIVGNVTNRVVACVYENQASTPHLGSETVLTSRGGDSKLLKGRVVSLGPIIKELPQRCWAHPNQPAWGREMVVLLDDHAELIAGEAFNLRLRDNGTAISQPAVAATPGARPDGAQLMVLPAELRQTSRFEPSGLIWAPHLARYVVISDDTGHRRRDDHAAWLFTMDSRGRVDDQPLRVDGAEKFNDLESVAAAPGGALYLLSSQSYSKKGKRKPARQAFCRLIPQELGYRVASSVSLAALLDAADPRALAALGIADTRQLNIEGMTAGQNGLLLGLKAPLAADGSAIIWRMADPERLLETGRLEDAGLTLWRTVKLEVQADGRTVPGGVAELLQLPDGSLAIAATASGIKPARQSGGLWLAREVATAGRMLPARALRTFPGLKPEGLALSPKPGHLMVVFDADQGSPAWTELPWPRN